MRTILPDRLWIAPSDDVNSLRDFLNAGGRAIIQLAYEEPSIPIPRDVMIGRFPLIDGAGNDKSVLRAALTLIRFLISNAIPTLVGCSAGMSRSPCIAAAGIALAEHRQFEECLGEITKTGLVDISPRLLVEVAEITREMEEQTPN